MNNKKVFSLIAILALGLNGLSGCSKTEEASKTVPPGHPPVQSQSALFLDIPAIVAKVNDQEITKESFEQEVKRTQQILIMQRNPSMNIPVAQIRKEALEGLISRELLRIDTQKHSIKTEDKDVDEQIDSLRKRFKNEDDFMQALVRDKLTLSSLRTQLAQGMAIKKLIKEKIEKNIVVSEKEMKDFYEKDSEKFKQPPMIKASHILIKVDPKADEATKTKARKKIEEIQEKLKKGEDFSELAKQYSEGPSGARGGDLGFFSKGQMVKQFEEVAYSLEKEKVSGLVETQFGYHLIKVNDKKPAGMISFEKIKPRLNMMFKQQKIQEKLKSYLQELKQKARIEIFIKNVS